MTASNLARSAKPRTLQTKMAAMFRSLLPAILVALLAACRPPYDPAHVHGAVQVKWAKPGEYGASYYVWLKLNGCGALVLVEIAEFEWLRLKKGDTWEFVYEPRAPSCYVP